MATAPSYAEQQQMMDREKNLMENLMDFSFRRMVTPRMLQMLYGLHLLLGFSVAIWFVFKAFQSSTSDGLLTVILGVAALFLWVVYLPDRGGSAGSHLPRRRKHHQFSELTESFANSSVAQPFCLMNPLL